MKVLILGCGYTGSRLANFLINHGIPIAVTTRQGRPPEDVNAPCYTFFCEINGESILPPPEALQDVTHVLSSIPPDHQGTDPVVACLMPALEQAELQWFGYLSTTGVYGDTQGAWVDETAEVNPQNQRSQHRIDAESAFLNSKLPSHIFRLPGIYGPGRSIFDRLRAGTAKRIDRPGHVFSRIHVEDIVRTLWASMQQPNPNSIYNVSDDQPTEPSHLIVEATHLLGISSPEPVPFDPASMSPMGASFWSECRRVANQKIKTELGVVLKYPTYREGLRAILRAEQANTTSQPSR
jgi:nucleoside-diphosphate-sugar epimerase